jgi:hypothetical protein
LKYATVHKEREKGRVVSIVTAVVMGTRAAVAGALERSSASRTINTSFLERHHLTDRHHNARKSRKSYRFSKDWRMHEAMTYFTKYSYNFCQPVRTLRERADSGPWQRRTPRDGVRIGRSRVVTQRMANVTGRSTALGRNPRLNGSGARPFPVGQRNRRTS